MGRIEYERIENRGLIGMAHMVESDHDVALEDTDRIHGRTALVNNVKAASSLAGAIRHHRRIGRLGTGQLPLSFLLQRCCRMPLS